MNARKLAAPLISWYRQNARPLPWRDPVTPYRVWISEVMLQQTRIEAVIPYFERFLHELPDVQSLAAVPDDRLMKLWEGLGYYSRARNLKKAAITVVNEFGGQLPADYDSLRRLPGFGDYTAGAVASIAFGIPVPAVDGNVLRVAARLLSDFDDITVPATKKRLTAVIREWIPSDDAGDFNSALMELGERICLPNTVPRCADCPLTTLCAGWRENTADKLPTRTARKARRVQKMAVMIVLSDEVTPRILLHRRPKGGLLAGMWELPNFLSDMPSQKELQEQIESLGGKCNTASLLCKGRHLFTHIEWDMTGYVIRLPYFCAGDEYAWASLDELQDRYAIPAAFRCFCAYLPILTETRDSDE